MNNLELDYSQMKTLKKTSLKRKSDTKKKTLKIFLEPTLSNQDRVSVLKHNSQGSKDSFCKSLHYDECTDENSFCSYDNDIKCFYNHEQEQQFLDSINYQCHRGCQCPQERPYEYIYRGHRKYCTSNLKSVHLLSLDFKAYNFTEFSSIRKQLKKYGLLRFLIKNIPSLIVGTISGIAKQLLNRIISIYCFTYLSSWKLIKYNRGTLSDAQNEYQEMKTKFMDNITSGNFKTDFSSISKGIIIGYLGAQEEFIFRESLSEYTQFLKPKIFKLMKKLNFSDKVTIQNVKKVYFLFDMVFTGVTFGLAHLGNLNTSKNISGVLCQVVYTTVGSWIFYFLAKFGNLKTAWIAHFSNNFFAHTIK